MSDKIQLVLQILFQIQGENQLRCDSLIEIDDADDFDDVVIVHDTSPEYAQQTVDRLKQEIKKHIDQVCVMLQKKLFKHTQADYQKIWTNYEMVYFAEVMYSLEQIYALAYADVLNGLQDSLPKLTPYTLAMDNQIILQLFEDLELEVENREASESTVSQQQEVDFCETCDCKNRELCSCKYPVQKVAFENLNISSKESKGSCDVATLAVPGFENENVLSQDTTGIETKSSNINVSSHEQELDTSQNAGATAPFRSRFQSDPVFPSVRSCSVEISGSVEKHLEVALDDPISGMNMSEYNMNKDRSSSDLNMNLAEQMIQNSASGNIKQELLKTTRQTSQQHTSDETSPSHVHSHLNASTKIEVDVGLNPGLDESFASTKTVSKSKYANVWEQINLDYARQVEKNIHIYYPISINFWGHERSTWPLVGRAEENIEFASDAMLYQNSNHGLDDVNNLSSRQTFTSTDDLTTDTLKITSEVPNSITQMIYTKSVHIQKRYLHQLNGVIEQLKLLCSEPVPTTKLNYAFKALHELGNQVKLFHTQITGRIGHLAAPSADDLTDFLVVLLCNCDIALVKSLYINVQIMRDHIPENLESGPYGFALMQLTICLHFLQERIVMQRGLIENERARLSSSLFRI